MHDDRIAELHIAQEDDGAISPWYKVGPWPRKLKNEPKSTVNLMQFILFWFVLKSKLNVINILL